MKESPLNVLIPLKVTHATVNGNQITRRLAHFDAHKFKSNFMSSLVWRSKETEKSIFMVIAVDTWDDGTVNTCNFHAFACVIAFLERGLPDLIGAWNLYFHRETHTHWTMNRKVISSDRFLIIIYLFTLLWEIKKEMHCTNKEGNCKNCPLKHFFSFHQKKKSLWTIDAIFHFATNASEREKKKIWTEKAEVKECPLCVIQKNL